MVSALCNPGTGVTSVLTSSTSEPFPSLLQSQIPCPDNHRHSWGWSLKKGGWWGWGCGGTGWYLEGWGARLPTERPCPAAQGGSSYAAAAAPLEPSARTRLSLLQTRADLSCQAGADETPKQC